MAKNKEPLQPVEVAPEDPVFAVTLRADNAFEYHRELAKSLIEDIFDPATPTRYIEVPAISAGGSVLPGVKRFLNTMYIKEIDVRGFA